MRTLTTLIFSGLTALVSAQAFQQEIPDKDQKIANEQAVSIFTSVREVTRPVAQTVFPIYSYRQQIAYGVSLGEGRLLAKWSELARAPHLYLANKDGQGLVVKPIGVYPEHDLVVIEAEGFEAPKAKWADGSDLAAGSFLAAVDARGEAQAVGVVSVPARSLREEDQGFLGISMAHEAVPNGVLVSGTVRNSAAHRIGIEGGDLIQKINDQEVDGFYELSSMLRRLKVGEKPKIQVLREGKILTFQPTLGGRELEELPESGQLREMDRMSGSQSARRDDFPNVLQSDMELEAQHNGMPVVDMDGRIVGMVIARAGRISTLILPGELINQVLKEEPIPVAQRDWVPRRHRQLQPRRGQRRGQHRLEPIEPQIEQMRHALEQIERFLGR